MQFRCEKALLLSAIQICSRAVANKSTNPALEGLLITASDIVSLTGYNLETGIHTKLEAEVIEEGVLVVPARLFGEIIRKMPDESVVFSANGLQVTLDCGHSHFQLSALDATDYPQMPDVDGEPLCSVDQMLLSSMIQQTAFAISTDDIRPIHTGSLFELEDGTLSIVSVDGFRLALRKEHIDPFQENTSFVVPGVSLLEVSKICKESDSLCAITVGDKHILFTLENTTLVSRRLEGEFLAWRRAIPQNQTIQLTLESDVFLRAVERVSLVISEKLKTPLHLQLQKDNLLLSAKTPLGEASDCLPAQGVGAELEIGFNHIFLLDALKAITADTISLQLASNTSPCIITPAEAEADHFLYMILPVRLRGD